MKHVLLVLFVLNAAQTGEIDDYFGKYQSAGKPNQRALQFANGSVTDLIVDGVTYDILGVFE